MRSSIQARLIRTRKRHLSGWLVAWGGVHPRLCAKVFVCWSRATAKVAGPLDCGPRRVLLGDPRPRLPISGRLKGFGRCARCCWIPSVVVALLDRSEQLSRALRRPPSRALEAAIGDMRGGGRGKLLPAAQAASGGRRHLGECCPRSVPDSVSTLAYCSGSCTHHAQVPRIRSPRIWPTPA